MMKKAIYVNPQVQYVAVSVSDVLTLSVGGKASDGDLVNFSFKDFKFL